MEIVEAIKKNLVNHGGHCPESQVLKELKEINNSITKADVKNAVLDNPTELRFLPVVYDKYGNPQHEQEIALAGNVVKRPDSVTNDNIDDLRQKKVLLPPDKNTHKGRR